MSDKIQRFFQIQHDLVRSFAPLALVEIFSKDHARPIEEKMTLASNFIINFAERIAKDLTDKEEKQVVVHIKEEGEKAKKRQLLCDHKFHFHNVAPDHSQTVSSILQKRCRICQLSIDEIPPAPRRKKCEHKFIGQNFETDGGVGGTFSHLECSGCGVAVPKRAK